MATWVIMIGIQAVLLLVTIGFIIRFMFRKNDPLDEELMGKNKIAKE